MDVLSSRILLTPQDFARSRDFYRDTLGLGVYREFGHEEWPGIVFFLGNGLLEVSGHRADRPSSPIALWIQVRDVHAECARLRTLGVEPLREPLTEPWGLIEAHIVDPDGLLIHLVEIPADHPLRRDQR